jgi:hypothetical protein
MKNQQFLRNFKQRKLVWGGLAGLCLISAFWWHDTNRNPNFAIPPAPKAPQPNGFDYFVQAAQLYVPEPQALVTTQEPELNLKNLKAFKQGYPLKIRAAWLKQNSEALRLLKLGLKFQSQYPPRTDSIRPYSNFRGLGRLLISESRVLAAKGEWNGAARPALDCIHFGHATARGGPHIAWLRGYSISMIGMKTLQEITEGLDANTAKDAAHQLYDLTKTAPTVTAALTEEKWTQLQSYRIIFSDSNWRHQFAGVEARGENMAIILDSMMTGRKPTYGDRAKIWGVYLKGRFRMLRYSKRRLAQNYIAVADAAIAASQKTYRDINPKRGSDYFSDVFVSSYDGVRWHEAESQIKSSQLAAALALRAYKLEKGIYPATLNELVPAYLPTIPQDVFDNKPLRYKRDGATYKLWSIGPDGRDDGGKAALDKTKHPKQQSQLFSTSTGDFVYGVNQ